MDGRPILGNGQTNPSPNGTIRHTAPTSATANQDRNIPVPIEEGEIDSKTYQDPSVLEVPVINWAPYVEVKSVHSLKWDTHRKSPQRPTTGIYNRLYARRRKISQRIYNSWWLKQPTTQIYWKLWYVWKGNNTTWYQTNTGFTERRYKAGSVWSFWNTKSLSRRISEPQLSVCYTKDTLPSIRWHSQRGSSGGQRWAKLASTAKCLVRTLNLTYQVQKNKLPMVQTKKSNLILPDQSQKTTADSIYSFPLTGSANGRKHKDEETAV